MRLKYTEVQEYRQTQLAQQNNCCALCGELIEGDAVLDHDHKTGLVRRVLHRGCNALLGKIENNMARNKMTKTRLAAWAINLVDYISSTHTDRIHPKHKERKNATKKRLRTKNNKS
jgi:hypothetical protein